MVGGLDIGFDHLSAEMLKKKRQLDDASSASSPVSMIATTLKEATPENPTVTSCALPESYEDGHDVFQGSHLWLKPFASGRQAGRRAGGQAGGRQASRRQAGRQPNTKRR